MRSSTACTAAAALSIVREPVAADPQHLEVSPSLAGRWSELPPAVQRYLGTYLTAAGPRPFEPGDRPSSVEVTGPAPLPTNFAEDLAIGAPRMRSAFPALARRLDAVSGQGGTISVRIACEGTHDGAFFGYMLPTRRRVRFYEVHNLVVDGDRIVADQVAIDVRAIVRQLVG